LRHPAISFFYQCSLHIAATMLLLPIETETGYYLYSGWSNRIVEVSEALFSQYHTGVLNDELQAKAIRAGLLPDTEFDVEVFGPELISQAVAALESSGPEMLVLSLTEECNFRCDYCYYSGAYSDSRGHADKTMALETATAAIEWYFSFQRTEYRIGFYGGEPLLRFSLLKEIVAFAESKRAATSRVIFAVTTNGALLTDEECDFLADHDFETFVSIDGPEAVHDRYRKNTRGNPTFGRILHNLQRFRERHTDYFDRQVNYSMTIAPPDPLDEIVQFMKGNAELFGGKIPKVSTVRLQTGDDVPPLQSSSGREAFDFTRVWERFIESSLRGELPDPFSRAVCEAAVTKIHRRPMNQPSSLVTTGGQCTPGQRCYVDTGGVFHMCERVNAFFPVGSVAEGYDYERIGEYLKSYSGLIGSRCSDCWAARLCSKCIPMLAEGERMSESALEAFCERQKRDLSFKLGRYCAARAQNNGCFDFIEKSREISG
jgi:uncharacterized protein